MEKKFDLKGFLVKYTMVIILIIVFLFFNQLTGGRMLYPQNLSNLLLQNAYVVILSCGMLLCILTGGNIDLAVGSVVCLVGAIAAQLTQKTSWGALPIILIGIFVGLLVGVWQGYWIGYQHIPPFVVSLAGMFVFRGIGRVVLDSKTVAVTNKTFLDIFTSYIAIPGLDDGTLKVSALIVGIASAVLLIAWSTYKALKKKKLGYGSGSVSGAVIKSVIIGIAVCWYSYKLACYKGIPVMLLWVLAVVAIYGYITSKTAFGRYFYAVGGNEKAAKLSGINTNKIYFSAYVSMSVLAALSGLLCAARIGSVNGDTGNSFEMDAIGSCFIGGASAYGGTGTVGGAVIGAILMGIINQGMSIYGLNSNWQYVVKGAVLLLAVVFDIKVNNKDTAKA